MKKIMVTIFMTMLVTGLAISVGLASSSREEAVAMVKKGIAYLKANGKAKTLEEINYRDGEFVKGELYIFVINMQGRMLAHGGHPRLVGKSMIDFKSVDGQYINQEFIKMAGKDGHGWLTYDWVNPVTKRTESKSSYVELVEDMIFGCGIYH